MSQEAPEATAPPAEQEQQEQPPLPLYTGFPSEKGPDVMNTEGMRLATDAPPWLQEHAMAVAKSALVDGDIGPFYDSWSEGSKQCMNFIELGKRIMAFESEYGRFDTVVSAGPAMYRVQAPEFYVTRVIMLIDHIEFFVVLSFNKDREVGEFAMGRICTYHNPSYIKESRFERIVLSPPDSPQYIYTKPTRATTPQTPAALLVHANVNCDIDGRIGYTFPFKDLEYLACANIGLFRGEFTENQLETFDPIPPFTGQLLQYAFQRDEVSDLWIIAYSYAALYIPKILMKFSGIFKGIILINPAWDPFPESPMEQMTEEKIPRDVKLLVIGSKFDQAMPESDTEKWRDACTKLNIPYIYYDMCDHFLFPASQKPEFEYHVHEIHMSDVALRDIATFIRNA